MLSIYTTERIPEYITFTLTKLKKCFFKSAKQRFELKNQIKFGEQINKNGKNI